MSDIKRVLRFTAVFPDISSTEMFSNGITMSRGILLRFFCRLFRTRFSLWLFIHCSEWRMVGTRDCAKVLIELNNERSDSISDLLAPFSSALSHSLSLFFSVRLRGPAAADSSRHSHQDRREALGAKRKAEKDENRRNLKNKRYFSPPFIP